MAAYYAQRHTRRGGDFEDYSTGRKRRHVAVEAPTEPLEVDPAVAAELEAAALQWLRENLNTTQPRPLAMLGSRMLAAGHNSKAFGYLKLFEFVREYPDEFRLKQSASSGWFASLVPPRADGVADLGEGDLREHLERKRSARQQQQQQQQQPHGADSDVVDDAAGHQTGGVGDASGLAVEDPPLPPREGELASQPRQASADHRNGSSSSNSSSHHYSSSSSSNSSSSAAKNGSDSTRPPSSSASQRPASTAAPITQQDGGPAITLETVRNFVRYLLVLGGPAGVRVPVLERRVADAGVRMNTYGYSSLLHFLQMEPTLFRMDARGERELWTVHAIDNGASVPSIASAPPPVVLPPNILVQ